MTDAPIRMWLVDRLAPEHRRRIEQLARLPSARAVAVMPDSHPGEDSVNGVALATDGVVYPRAVGSDIGCGYSAIRLRPPGPGLGPSQLLRAFASMQHAVRILRHASIGAAPRWPAALDPGALSSDPLRRAAERDGRIELGTLGRGNHFVELQTEERSDEGVMWLMVHSGSRIMGQLTTAAHTGGGSRAIGLPSDSPRGRDYLSDMRWCVAYASASRRLILEAAAAGVASALGLAPEPESLIDIPHNTASLERIGDTELLVHRKSVSPAEPGRISIVPGCMGGQTFHAEGRGILEALNSCAHGAGRTMSRTDARRRISPRELETVARTCLLDRRLARRLLDEAPGAYRDIREVMRAQRDLVKIRRVLRGVAVIKGC